MNKDAEIVVNGETVGYGIEGMLAALPKFMSENWYIDAQVGKPLEVKITGTLQPDRVEQIVSLANDFGFECEISIHECDLDHDLTPIESSENGEDWHTRGHSSQGYQVYKCKVCGDVWGCRHQWDAGTGYDDHWKNFGQVDPVTVRRHY